ncbi:MAG: multiheme c-type cytochrome [Planctomycetaceae bacterium]
MSGSNLSPPPKTARVGVTPAVGARLRILMRLVFALIALLGANSAYLAGVTCLSWTSGQTYENWFYMLMFCGHLVLGLVVIVPFLVFVFIHLVNTRNRKNKRAIRVGYALLAGSLVLLISGLLLIRIDVSAGGKVFVIRDAMTRSVIYWAHVAAPLFCIWLYWLHRLAGPKIRWSYGLGYIAAVTGAATLMILLHNQDPRHWNQVGPEAGADKYFFPSLARTSTGQFIPASALMNDAYCLKCHPDAYQGWFHSSHHYSSFNNPAYLASVRETREVTYKRDGDVRGSRFCAGCHDPVPFFSGAFDDPQFDDVKHPTAQAGITCTVCHAITHVNSTRGNADFTIEEPEQYPFAFSENTLLQWVNNQLVKAKPALHKKTFLKDFHKSADFCSTCHKVHLPYALNHYKEFLRGQNHHDTYLLSGVSGHGARSFYYPEKAQQNCNGCHMPRQESQDFGAKQFAATERSSIHNHLFPGANTGLAWLKDDTVALTAHQDFLKDIVRVDIFGLKEGVEIDGNLIAPLRPEIPRLKPGRTYLLETVVRTLKLGHPFTQGTADSNEVWLDVTVTSGGKVVGRSGAMDSQMEVDPWSHFINVFMLDKDGNRIDRRNAQDIFTPLYNNQIPPGAAGTVHYRLEVPEDVVNPITVDVKLQYRKFDKIYTDFFTTHTKAGDDPIRGKTANQPYSNVLPVTTLASDRIEFAIEGSDAVVENAEVKIPVWQRWNDYGIGLLLKGRAQLKQAGEAFTRLELLENNKRYDGALNMARACFEEGLLDDATAAIARASDFRDPPAPPWTISWLTGLINLQQGQLEAAETSFRSVLEDKTAERTERGFDFSMDYEVINLLGQTLYEQAKQIRNPEESSARKKLLEDAASQYQKTLKLDSENVAAHHGLRQIYGELTSIAEGLGDHESAAAYHTAATKHGELHTIYKPDDNARDLAQHKAKVKYPAAAKASEPIVIYSLNRPGAPGLNDVGNSAGIPAAAEERDVPHEN